VSSTLPFAQTDPLSPGEAMPTAGS
jgi:hypothetical protein